MGSGDNLLACGLGRFPSRGLGGMILEVIRMVEEDGAMLSNSKHSIDLKTQFVAHVLIRYTILPKPPFTNK